MSVRISRRPLFYIVAESIQTNVTRSCRSELIPDMNQKKYVLGSVFYQVLGTTPKPITFIPTTKVG